MRRSEYCQGTGRLWVSGDRLLYVSIADHPLVEALERAARGERPTRAVASVVIAAGFNVPPFVFAEEGDTLQGIVFGEVQVGVDDAEGMVIDGAQGDPWSYLNRANDVSMTLAGTTTDGRLWLDSGVVLAGGFHWSRMDGGVIKDPHSIQAGSTDSPEHPTCVPPVITASEEPGEADSHGGAVGLQDESEEKESRPRHRGSLAEVLETELDTTVEAIRLAELRDQPIDVKPTGRPRRPLSRAVPDRRQAPSDTVDVARHEMLSDRLTTAQDAILIGGVDHESEQVPIGGQYVERRIVRSLVCQGCGSPNPLVASHCRGCAALLHSTSTDVRDVSQPVLGIVRLSDGREEMLNADLVVGRNPTYGRLGPHQRAVVHGEKDLSISRRHIELRLAGWKVMATSLAEGSGTTVESPEGAVSQLLPGVPHELVSGDTVRYGDAWLRFEADI